MALVTGFLTFDAPIGRVLAAEVAEVFPRITAPVHHICGNHDRDHLGVAQNEAILGRSLQNDVHDCADWQIA